MSTTSLQLCWKKAYDSAESARKANRRANFRIRTYRCPHCQKWHVTNGDKRMHKEY